MYTQCPDCDAAFRVTAQVLKQASGKVRCGSCGHAFNALAYLSETKPQPVSERAVKVPIPELEPESDRVTRVQQPVSAEQSAAFLKTLDQLAGSDVRIEDTGIEWRVLDLDDDANAVVDELLDESPTPVDEFLTDTPTAVDAEEIFEDSADAFTETAVDELRFDDDTPLPDDFALDEESSDGTERRDPEFTTPEDEPGLLAAGSNAEADITNDAEEWADILDEFEQDFAPSIPPLDAELAAIEKAEREAAAARQSSGDHVESETPQTSDDDDAAPDPDEESDGSDTRNQALNGDADDDHAPLEFGSSAAATGDDRPSGESHDDRESGDDGVDGLHSDVSDDQAGDAGGDPDDDPRNAPVSEKLIIEADISPGFESIVMEGEFVSSALDNDKRAADIAAAAALAEKTRSSWDDEDTEPTSGRSRGLMAACVALVALLLVQIVHQSREALLTIPVFEGIVGPVYRAIGRPVSPAWDVTGWRFEATSGSTDERGTQLTINSRIGNKSDGPLPYPLIGISLTDRYEETLGSKMLSPAEYLPGTVDPGQRLRPGSSFNAVFSIQSPTDAAVGFKLKVCYPLSNKQLRCASDGFK